MNKDKGASPDGDRAAGLRPQPPAASSQSSIPSAADQHVTYWPDVAVVQPLLEPEPTFIRKFGAFAAFAYLRWSCFAVGFDLMPGGAALHLGPVMFGAVKVRTFKEYAQAIEARRAETAHAGSVVDESAVPQGCAPTPAPTPEGQSS